VGPLLSVRLQMALHPDAERAAAHAAASEAANDGRRLGGGPGAGAAAGGYYAEQPPVQDNPMLDILQVRGVACIYVGGDGWVAGCWSTDRSRCVFFSIN
jgi:hypothetical protein